MRAPKVRRARVLLSGSLAILLICGLLPAASVKAQRDAAVESCALRIGETFRSRNGYFSIKFLEVESESRCPINATCAWEGFAAIKLAVRDGDRLEEITLFTEEQVDRPSTRTIFDRTIILVKLEPYPREDITVDAYRYVATLLIS